MKFWHKITDYELEQKEADKALAKVQQKIEVNREEFHNLQAICGMDVLGEYIQEIYRQRMRK